MPGMPFIPLLMPDIDMGPAAACPFLPSVSLKITNRTTIRTTIAITIAAGEACFCTVFPPFLRVLRFGDP
jgi:hypothetical protein